MEWDFSKIKVGQMINVQAYKHNGYLYRQWNDAKVIFHNKRHIVLFLKNTVVAEYEKDINGWRYNENAIWFIPKNSFYNAIVLLKDQGAYYYINMASKPIFEDGTIKFIDYDLDVKCYPDRDLQIVDREEFNIHSRMMSYPSKIKENIYEELKSIMILYNDYKYFFSEDVINYYLEVLYKDKLISDKSIEKFVRSNRKKYNEEISMFASIKKRY
ncbi:DUF402 domain-containing protein [Mycoplasma sp. Pen4]|uniref:DUF402 domain-containing protein n=1 Tax=Mycoplasma sp. Pen4 TaxID=640330 RepID=UPI001653F9F8|nr:DUF402 domain-containing protein [Mycoplasma sp. Pen4]QNM93601.1 DUF402 domain-containing protein [Mycoplasma sp. Pen4]